MRARSRRARRCWSSGKRRSRHHGRRGLHSPSHRRLVDRSDLRAALPSLDEPRQEQSSYARCPRFPPIGAGAGWHLRDRAGRRPPPAARPGATSRPRRTRSRGRQGRLPTSSRSSAADVQVVHVRRPGHRRAPIGRSTRCSTTATSTWCCWRSACSATRPTSTPIPEQAVEAAEVNYVGAVSAGLIVADRFRRQGHGTLVVLSSVAAERARRTNFVYGSTKAGLDAFAQGLSDSLVGTGARVMVVRPGFVHTRMTTGMDPQPLSTTPEVVAEQVDAGPRAGQRDRVGPRSAALGLRRAPPPPEATVARGVGPLIVDDSSARRPRRRPPPPRGSTATCRPCAPGSGRRTYSCSRRPIAAGDATTPARIGLGRALAFVAFCMAASGTYLVNDIRDVESDRLHPVKRDRPIAAGIVRVGPAYMLAARARARRRSPSASRPRRDFGITLLRLPRADHRCTPSGSSTTPSSTSSPLLPGFVLRAIGGATATGLPISEWFFIVTSFGALLIVVGKRESELHSLGEPGRARSAPSLPCTPRTSCATCAASPLASC